MRLSLKHSYNQNGYKERNACNPFGWLINNICFAVTKIVKGKITKDGLYPFNSQDLISNSPYCLPYNSYNVSSENLVLDQLIIP